MDTFADPNFPPPIFGAEKSEKPSKPSVLNLDDMFGDILFDQEDVLGDLKPDVAKQELTYSIPTPAPTSNGIEIKLLDLDKALALDKDDDGFMDSDGDDVNDEDGDAADKKRNRGVQRVMTEEQKFERREGNREHAKRSRVRKKFLLESLQQSVHALQEENDKLKLAIKANLPEDADELLASCMGGGTSVIATDPGDATKTLDDPDYSLVKALQTAQQNFVISDPSMPDNPIVYASSGFLHLSGYSLDQVLGRNCRFLQGPETDPRSVDRIRKGIEKGDDTTVVLLNYRMDGSTFWNQFFVAALRDRDGNVVNYLGVQCKVSEDYAKAFGTNETFEDTKKH